LYGRNITSITDYATVDTIIRSPNHKGRHVTENGGATFMAASLDPKSLFLTLYLVPDVIETIYWYTSLCLHREMMMELVSQYSFFLDDNIS